MGLVPAWSAEAFIATTLRSLAAQTYPNFRVIISDDASPDRTVEICEEYAASDPRFTVIRQPENLGWIRNMQALLKEADADYFFIGYHDDTYEPDFVEHLVEAAESVPGSVGAFSDVDYSDYMGTSENRVFDDLDGLDTAYDRVAALIDNRRFAWYPHHGLMRLSTIRKVGPIRSHFGGQRGAACYWVMKMVAEGEFVRVPKPLIHKNKLEEGLSNRFPKGVFTDLAWHVAAAQAVAESDLPLGQRLGLIGRVARLYLRVAPSRIKRAVFGKSSDGE